MREGERQARLVFGSCRVGAPETPPYTLSPSDDPKGLGVDALWAYSRRLQTGDAPWPDGLLLLGDQIYADEVPPETAAFIKGRRSTDDPPGESVADFEEYARLFRESWSDPDIRWLLATVPSTMIFDDHEVSDDWNISQSWVDEMRALPWWDERITSAFMAYWLYQHLGNLSPPELAEEEMFAQVQRDEDAGPRLRNVRAHVRSRVGREPVGVLPRLRTHAPAGDRFACCARPRRRSSRHGRRGRVGVDLRARPRLVRSSDRRDDAAGVRTARHPPPRGVERGGLRRALGIPGGPSRRAAAPHVRSRALGRVPALVRTAQRPPAGSQPRHRRRAAGDDRRPQRRRPHDVHGRGRSRGRRRAESRLSTRLLAVPESSVTVSAADRHRGRIA